MSVPRDPDDTLDLFTFAVGPHTYAVDVQRVDEVLPPLELPAGPRRDALVEGTVVLRERRCRWWTCAAACPAV